MLTDILRALATGRPRTMTELANDLGTNPRILRLALEHCQRLGYLEQIDASTRGGPCEGCATRKACAACSTAPPAGNRTPSGLSWWQLTANGLRAIGTAERTR